MELSVNKCYKQSLTTYAVKYYGLLQHDTPILNRDGIDKAFSCDLYELELQDTLSDLFGKLFIDWGSEALAWVQYAERNDKKIIEHYDLGITNKISNPFYNAGWCRQNLPLTPHRKDQLRKLLFQSVENIGRMNPNEGSYVAFIAIRWGFAEIVGGDLIGTKKLSNEGIMQSKHRNWLQQAGMYRLILSGKV